MATADRFQSIVPSIPGIQKAYLIYDDGLLRIQGRDRDDSIVVEFRFVGPLLTRVSDEGVRLKLIPDLPQDGSVILRDQQSELLAWIADEGLHTREMKSVMHFVVFVGEEIIDVVAFDDPEIIGLSA